MIYQKIKHSEFCPKNIGDKVVFIKDPPWVNHVEMDRVLTVTHFGGMIVSVVDEETGGTGKGFLTDFRMVL
uniref:Uncharacterized protein n=1 Tax=viral metagenome TaxID=1070528 RepID=A0A6M3XN27_9ZZZZ